VIEGSMGRINEDNRGESNGLFRIGLRTGNEEEEKSEV